MVILSLEEKVDQINFQVGHNYDVYITCMHDPSDFYVRSVSITRYDMRTLEKRGKRISLMDVHETKLVTYYSETLNKIIRGKIYTIARDNEELDCAIFAIDYGFYDMRVPLTKIYEPGGHETVGPLAIPCRLWGCFPAGQNKSWQMSIGLIALKFLDDPKVNLFIRVKTDHNFIVDLYSGTVSISEWMIYNKLASPVVWYERRHDEDNNE